MHWRSAWWQTEQSELFYGDADSMAAVAATVPLGRLAMPSRNRLGRRLFSLRCGVIHQWYHMAVHGGGEPPPYLAASSANK